MTGDVDVKYLDLAKLSSIAPFADSIDSVDVLINNAAVFGIPFTGTVDGFEPHMGTHHLGHFALTCLLGKPMAAAGFIPSECDPGGLEAGVLVEGM